MSNSNKNPIEYLKNGRIVKMRNGNEYLYLENNDCITSQFLVGRNNESGWEDFGDYRDDLTFNSESDYLRDFDIVAIYKLETPYQFRLFLSGEDCDKKLVWERKEDDCLTIGIAAVTFANPTSPKTKDKIYFFEIPYEGKFSYPTKFPVDKHVLVDTQYGTAEAIIKSTHFFDSKSEAMTFMKKDYPQIKLPLKKVIGTINPTKW